MIQLSSLLPQMPQGPGRPALPASRIGGFALARLVAPETEAESPLPMRQALAEPGKDLPEPTDNEEKRQDGTDIAFAWFAVAEPVPVALSGQTMKGAVPGQSRADEAGLAVADHLVPAHAEPSAAAAPEIADAPVAKAAARPVDTAIAPAQDRPALATPAPPPVLATPAPSEMFGPGLEAAILMPAATPRRAPAIELAAGVLGARAPDAAQPHIVTPASDSQQPALDTNRHEWIGKMVEQIEALRDAAPVRETRLSLVPEALGKVEVSIRHDGDRVHVHFATETPAARQLIADAQPRLSELAEARGLKLGQTSFESGTAGQGAPRDRSGQPAPQQSRAPRPATDPIVDPADTDRIA